MSLPGCDPLCLCGERVEAAMGIDNQVVVAVTFIRLRRDKTIDGLLHFLSAW